MIVIQARNVTFLKGNRNYMIDIWNFLKYLIFHYELKFGFIANSLLFVMILHLTLENVNFYKK